MSPRSVVALVLALGMALTLGSVSMVAREAQLPLRLSAHAVNLSTGGPGGSLGVVDVVINRWSNDAERDRLLKTLSNEGARKLLDSLQDLPTIGYIRTADNVPFELHYARHAPSADGGDRVVIATDRYISFQESSEHPSILDYPFTFIEVRLDKQGAGEGRISVTTKIVSWKNEEQIVLENFASEPVRLHAVRAHWASR